MAICLNTFFIIAPTGEPHLGAMFFCISKDNTLIIKYYRRGNGWKFNWVLLWERMKIFILKLLTMEGFFWILSIFLYWHWTLTTYDFSYKFLLYHFIPKNRIYVYVINFFYEFIHSLNVILMCFHNTHTKSCLVITHVNSQAKLIKFEYKKKLLLLTLWAMIHDYKLSFCCVNSFNVREFHKRSL